MQLRVSDQEDEDGREAVPRNFDYDVGEDEGFKS